MSLQGAMYVYAFKAVGESITIAQALRIFLKRNLVSVFLPGGGVTSLMFFNDELERKGVNKSHIGFASYIYGVVGFASLALVAVPVIAYLTVTNSGVAHLWTALAVIIAFIALLILRSCSFVKRGWVYYILNKWSPQIETLFQEISAGKY